MGFWELVVHFYRVLQYMHNILYEPLWWQTKITLEKLNDLEKQLENAARETKGTVMCE